MPQVFSGVKVWGIFIYFYEEDKEAKTAESELSKKERICNWNRESTVGGMVESVTRFGRNGKSGQ